MNNIMVSEKLISFSWGCTLFLDTNSSGYTFEDSRLLIGDIDIDMMLSSLPGTGEDFCTPEVLIVLG